MRDCMSFQVNIGKSKSGSSKVRPLLSEGDEVVPAADEGEVAGDGGPIRDEDCVHQSQLTW